MKNSFAAVLGIKEKIISTFNMIQTSIISVGTSNINGTYLWDDLTENIPLCGIVIFIIVVIGFIVNRKEIFSKICALWILFAFVLFAILNWSTGESPLFNIYFSWAIIPLFVYGFDFIIEKLKISSKVSYHLIYVFVFLVNITTMTNIYKFLL